MNYHKTNCIIKVNNFITTFEFIEENNEIEMKVLSQMKLLIKLMIIRISNLKQEKIRKQI